MPGLSNIFNNGDDSNNQDNNTSLDTGTVADVTSVLGLDATNNNQQSSTDEDGNTQQSSSDQAVGLDTSTDGLLGNVTDFLSSNDSSSTDN